MFIKRELMIQGLRRQQILLEDLIQQIEFSHEFDGGGHLPFFYDHQTRQVAKNLRRLRKIKDGYFSDKEVSLNRISA